MWVPHTGRVVSNAVVTALPSGRFSLSDGFEAEYHAILTGMKLMKLVFIILGLAHWLGCAWYYCGDVRKEETVEFHDDGTPIVGWVHYVGKEQFSLPKEADYYTRYMSSLYWSIMTMTTVGYGNISASTYSELLCSIVGMMGGGFAFGAIVGNLSEFSRRSNPGKNLESKRTGILRAFLVERGANARLTKRISLWYMGHLGFHTPMESESMLLNMPAQLRDELMVELGYATGKSKSDSVQYSIVHRVPFLSTLDNVSLIMISLRLNFERFAWSDINLEDENQSVRDNELMSVSLKLLGALSLGLPSVLSATHLHPWCRQGYIKLTAARGGRSQSRRRVPQQSGSQLLSMVRLASPL